MQQNFSSTKLPTSANQTPSEDGAFWANPSRITADDGSSSTLSYFNGGDQGAAISGSAFNFQQLPNGAVIDGIAVYIDGSNTGCYGTVNIGLPGEVPVAKDIGSLNGTYGGASDLWGLDSIDPADIASITANVNTGDVSGGDGTASIDYLSITVFWHIEVPSVPADVPTRVEYKVYSSDGAYLGLLPKVTSKFAFPQDINSAGSSIVVTCGQFVNNEVTVAPLLTEDGDVITTEDDLPILVAETELLVAEGISPDNAIFKNGNRVVIWLYNQYWPNGKPEFAGQINRVDFKYGGGDASAKLTIYSDGLDLSNYVARGYPFVYTGDVTNASQNTSLVCSFEGGKGGGWYTLGQTWITGGAVTTLGAISILLQGTADVTLNVYDAPNGNLIASTAQSVSAGGATEVQFAFPSLVTVSPSTQYFFAIWLPPGQSIRVYLTTPTNYAGGQAYESSYSGGSGGGIFTVGNSDFYFKTFSGVPTTTTTYTTDDPVTDMAHGILLDYNLRGGRIRERNFGATGLSLTYTFVVAFITDAIKKILELCPTGYYAFVDLGTSELDILPMNTSADFTVVKGRHIHELNIGLTIEQVKNYLLFTGGDTGGGVNLYRDYQDTESSAAFGIRTSPKTDNRVTVTATANAIGETFIEENAGEKQETSLVVLNTAMDITQLIPGKTIGFANFGNFIDDMVLPIVRREPNYTDGYTRLTLGRLPVRMNDEVQRINRELLDSQTIANPTAPS